MTECWCPLCNYERALQWRDPVQWTCTAIDPSGLPRRFGKGATSKKAHDDALLCQPRDNAYWGGWQFISSPPDNWVPVDWLTVLRRGGEQEVYRDLRQQRQSDTITEGMDGISAAELRELPDGLLTMWGDIFSDNAAILEGHVWGKITVRQEAAVLRWAEGGDWDALADYIEEGGERTPEIDAFIVGILRGAKKPKKPATLAKQKRDFAIINYILSERADRKTKAAAIDGAVSKFNLAYDTIEDIFDENLAEYQKRLARDSNILAAIALSWRGMRAVAEEFRRRGINHWISSAQPFDGAFGDLEEYLIRGVVTPDIITP